MCDSDVNSDVGPRVHPALYLTRPSGGGGCWWCWWWCGGGDDHHWRLALNLETWLAALLWFGFPLLALVGSPRFGCVGVLLVAAVADRVHRRVHLSQVRVSRQQRRVELATEPVAGLCLLDCVDPVNDHWCEGGERGEWVNGSLV